MLELSSPGTAAEQIARSLISRFGLGENSGPPPPAPAPAAVASIVGILRESRLPLAGMRQADHPDLQWLFESRDFERLVGEHRHRRQAYEREFATFLEFAARAGMPVIVIKACDSFPYESSNLDLLVPAVTMVEAAAILQGQGFLQLCHYREPHKSLHKKFIGNLQPITFHLHQELSWDGAVFLDRQAVWDRRRDLPGASPASQMDPADLAAQTMAHVAYENGSARFADLRRILWSLELSPQLFPQVQAIARDHGWLRGLHAATHAVARLEHALCGTSRCMRAFGIRRIPAPPALTTWFIPLGKLRARLLLAEKIVRCPRDSCGDRARTLAGFLASKARAFSRLPSHPPALIALSGVDGSGKSHHAQGLSKFLNQCDLHARVVWARGGSTRLMLLAKRVLRLLTGGKGPLAVKSEADPLPRRWQRALWPWTVALELLLTYAFRVRIPLLLKQIVVCDRYMLDASVDLCMRLGGTDPRPLLPWQLLLRLAPTPDLHVVLDVGSQEVSRRKDVGMLAARIDQRRTCYRRLAGPGVRFVAAGGPEASVAEDLRRMAVQSLGGALR